MTVKCKGVLLLAALALSLAACGSQPDPEPDETADFYAQAGDKVWTRHVPAADDTGESSYDIAITFREDHQFFGELYSPESCYSYRFQGDYLLDFGVLTLTYQWDSSPGVTHTDSYSFSIVGSSLSMDLTSDDDQDNDGYPVSYAAYSDYFTSTELKEDVLKYWGVGYD